MRNKIQRHETIGAHLIAQELTKKSGQDLLGNLVRSVSETVLAETDAVFRTAYYLVKMNPPFTDYDNLSELQETNGANMGTSLHLRYSYIKIVEHTGHRQAYRGLTRRMQIMAFLYDLGLMYDALSELTNLSQQLQAHSITLLRADQLLKRTIRVLALFKEEKSEDSLTAQALGHFGSVPLESNAKLTQINAKQFLQSLINNMEKRLSFEDEMLHDLSILNTGN